MKGRHVNIYCKKVLYKGHCVDKPLVSQPLTSKWLGRTRVALMSVAGPGSLCESFHIKHTACIHLGHCCGSCERSHKNVCYSGGPATGGERHCFATVAVAQPVRVSSEGSGSCRQLRGRPLEQRKGLSGGLGTSYKVPHTLVTPKANPEQTLATLWPCERTEMYYAVYQLFILWGGGEPGGLWEGNRSEEQEM